MNEDKEQKYITIQPSLYLKVSINEYRQMEEQGILMEVKEIKESNKALLTKLRGEISELDRIGLRGVDEWAFREEEIFALIDKYLEQ